MQALTLPWCPYLHAADDRHRAHPWSVRQRRLAHWLLVTSLRGRERILVEGRSYDVDEGATYCIQPGRLHSLEGSHSTPVWVHADLVFDPHRAAHPHAGSYDSELGARRSLLQPDAQALFGIDLPVLVGGRMAGRFRAAMPHIVALHRRGDPLAVLDAHQRLGDLMLAWVGDLMPAGGPPQAEADRLARVDATVQVHLDLDWPVEALAEVAGMSRSVFCAAWRRLRGDTPAAWLRRIRMERADRLLRQGGLSVAEVGRLVGYGEPSVFARAFRAVHGRLPGDRR
jgi:AraC-like DNA-binding protein